MDILFGFLFGFIAGVVLITYNVFNKIAQFQKGYNEIVESHNNMAKGFLCFEEFLKYFENYHTQE
jgi:uncharacterized membrane protein required for colicin V production